MKHKDEARVDATKEALIVQALLISLQCYKGCTEDAILNASNKAS